MTAIYSIQCKTPIQRTDSLYYTVSHTKQTRQSQCRPVTMVSQCCPGSVNVWGVKS